MTLRIGDVEFPRELINAHESGQLVLFVGAGASMGPPSSLPSFWGLTELIRDESQLTEVIGSLDGKALDELLGRVEDEFDVDVHLRAAAHIGREDSHPNPLHEAIASLASSRTVRIVTTNYDQHIIDALNSPVTEYLAPALPMGDNFTGLVYLHGCLRQGPDKLIITDRDFGRAYLTEAWAARFLERMFAAHPVLFIGYSHNDVIMKYLARGLGRSRDRYILTDQPQSPTWKQLNITPIEYCSAESHQALVQAISGWASQAGMGLLDHQQQIRTLVENQPPPRVPEDVSYLQTVVAHHETVALFTKYARGEAWLSWTSGRPEFQRLFDRSADPTSVTGHLANWFATNFITDELSDRALAIAREAGGHLGPDLREAVGRRLLSFEESLPAEIRPWLVLLVRDTADRPRDYLDFLLPKCSLTHDPDSTVLLFSHQTEPQLRLNRSAYGGSRFELRLRGDDRQLQTSWDEVFRPHLPTAADQLLAVVDQQLRRAHREFTIVEGPSAARSLSRTQMMIAPGPDSPAYRGPLRFLIDAARDCVETLLNSNNAYAYSQLEAWAASDAPLLRRLAIYGWIRRTDIDPTEKLSWLLNQHWVIDDDLRSEVTELIAHAVPNAETSVADRLVNEIVTAAGDDNVATHKTFRMLQWVHQHAPDLISAESALSALAAGHPDLQAALSVTDVPGIDSSAPITADELHRLIESDLLAAVVLLEEHAIPAGAVDAQRWFDMSAVVRQLAQQWPDSGLALLETVNAETVSGTELIRQIITGWSDSQVSARQAARILDQIASLELPPIVDAVTGLLSGLNANPDNASGWRRQTRSRYLAVNCWDEIKPTAPPTMAGRDWVETALNHPAGHLALFWAAVVYDHWRDNSTARDGLAEPMATQLEIMLSCTDFRGFMVEVVFASQLRLFHDVDPAWCIQNLMPLLGWTDESRAVRAWEGYLWTAKLNDPLLAAGLLEQMLTAVEHRSDLTKEHGQVLLDALAEVAVKSETDPGTWIPRFIRQSTLDDRVAWAEHIADVLNELPTEHVEQQWKRWMRSYWQRRLQSVPRRMNTQEASAMARWAVYLGDSLSEGIELATRHRAGLPQHSPLLHALTEERITSEPEQFAHLVVHVLAGTQMPFYEGYELPQLFDRLTTLGASRPSLDSIAEQAMRLGISLLEA